MVGPVVRRRFGIGCVTRMYLRLSDKSSTKVTRGPEECCVHAREVHVSY
jgi:hypothetical protein